MSRARVLAPRPVRALPPDGATPAGTGAGARPSAASTSGTCSALQAAAERGDHAACLALVAAGADPLAGDQCDVTPMHVAANHGDLPVLAVLLGHVRGSIDVMDDHGWTPIMVAAAQRRVACARLLVVHGGDPTLSSDGLNAADIARVQGIEL